MTGLFLRLGSGTRLSYFPGRLFRVLCCLLAFPSVVEGLTFEASASGIISTKDRGAFPSLRANFPGRSPAWSRSRNRIQVGLADFTPQYSGHSARSSGRPSCQTFSQTPDQVWRTLGLGDFAQDRQVALRLFPGRPDCDRETPASESVCRDDQARSRKRGRESFLDKGALNGIKAVRHAAPPTHCHWWISLPCFKPTCRSAAAF